MRHGKKVNHLSRKSAHRKAMLSNMATSLILHKRINTTLAKAKALRTYIEPLITKSKDDSTHSRRMVFSYLQSKEAVTELFRDISVKVADRPGGYTRIIKTGARLGDNAEMCMIELVDYNENLLGDKGAAKAKSTRRRRGAAKKQTEETTPVVEAKAETAVEEVVEAPAEVEEKVEAKVEETPEAKVEEPEAEVKEELKAEEPKVEEPKAEVKAEEPKAEVKEEAAEEKKEDTAEEDKKEETK
jgi:large subunit ribosomal protein L17